jgi:hypothetical protein
MSAREKLLSTLSVLAFGSAVSATPTSAQVQQLDCIFIGNLFNAEQLLEISRTDTSCGPAAMDRYFELKLTDPQFGETAVDTTYP